MGPLCRAVTDKKAPMPGTQVGNQGRAPWRPRLKMAPWELTGKVRREERGHGVRKLPVPGAG